MSMYQYKNTYYKVKRCLSKKGKLQKSVRTTTPYYLYIYIH